MDVIDLFTQQLVDMGFSETTARSTLQFTQNQFDEAVQILTANKSFKDLPEDLIEMQFSFLPGKELATVCEVKFVVLKF